MATAVASYAWPAPTGSMRPPTARSRRRKEAGRTGDGTGTYQWIFWLMVGGGIVIAVVAKLRVHVGVRRHHRGAVGAGAVRRVLAHPDVQKWEPPTAEELQQATEEAAGNA